jgi:hypothetical protein
MRCRGRNDRANIKFYQDVVASIGSHKELSEKYAVRLQLKDPRHVGGGMDGRRSCLVVYRNMLQVTCSLETSELEIASNSRAQRKITSRCMV